MVFDLVAGSRLEKLIFDLAVARLTCWDILLSAELAAVMPGVAGRTIGAHSCTVLSGESGLVQGRHLFCASCKGPVGREVDVVWRI